MNATKSVCEALCSPKIDEKDHEFSHIFDLSLNSYHKMPILKNSKKLYAATCRPIVLVFLP
jgi:hypothetical protein